MMSATDSANHPTLGPLVLLPLSSGDEAAFLALCARHPLRLLTPRMNYEAHGFSGGGLRFWGAFTQDRSEILGILIRMNNTMIAVDGDGSCSGLFAHAIDLLEDIAGIRGTVDTVSGIQAALQRYIPTDWEDSPFMRLLRPPACPPETLALARRAIPEDLDMLAALYAEAGVMHRSRANVAGKLAESRVF